MHALQKYLTQWTAEECQNLDTLPGQWQQVLVIPAYRESLSLLDSKMPALHSGNSLVILVINRPDTDTDTSWAETLITELGAARWQQGQLSLHPLTDSAELLVVDRACRGLPLPHKEGVGGARKIGADIACQLIAQGRVHSPWIFNTDADALLPEDYFQACTGQRPRTAACLYPFQHIFKDPSLPQWPTLVYEYQLHHYVSGLRRAGSPYAWHTVGSTLAVHYEYYAAARGFPRRSGGEDFYLLNKLAKLGDICSLPGPLIALEARYSERVPFGTGPATLRLSQLANPADATSYHPWLFVYLQQLLRLLEQAASDPRFQVCQWLTENREMKLLPELIDECGIADAIADCQRRRGSASWRQQQLMQWFDAFKTLKCLHWLRDRALPDIPIAQIIGASAPGTDHSWSDIHHAQQRLLQLNRQQRVTLADGHCRGIRSQPEPAV